MDSCDWNYIYGKNVLKAITRVILGVAYQMNVMKFSFEDIKGMDMIIKSD